MNGLWKMDIVYVGCILILLAVLSAVVEKIYKFKLFLFGLWF